MKHPVTFWIIIAFVFLVGGAFQTVGLVSNTISSLGLGLLLIVISLSSITKQTKAWPHLLILLCILVSGIINKTRIPLMGLYALTFVMIPFAVKLYVTNNVDLIPKRLLFSFFTLVGCLQLPVVIVQRVYGASILAHMARAIDLEDVAYGTFFVANDHGMCFFLIAMIAFLLFEPIQYFQRQTRIILVCIFASCILLANSNIAFVLMAVVFAIYFFRSMTPGRIAAILVPVVALAVISGVSPNFMSKLETRTDFLYHKLADKDMSRNGAQGAVDQGMAERTDLIIFFVTEKLKIIGDGPFTYFDPIKKEFPRFKNYSQYLWFYSDLGLIGVFLVFVYYFSEYRKRHPKTDYRAILLGVILVFSLFTNTMSDLAFNFTFFLFVKFPWFSPQEYREAYGV